MDMSILPLDVVSVESARPPHTKAMLFACKKQFVWIDNNDDDDDDDDPVYIAPYAELQRFWMESQLGRIKTVIKKKHL